MQWTNSLVLCRSWRCPEIPDILKVFLKFTPIPDFFCRCPDFLSTSVNGASVQGTQAFISLCPCELRPNCGPWKLKDILVLWHCWRYETNSALILLVLGYYCIFRWLNGTFSAGLHGFMSWKCLEILKFSCPKMFLPCRTRPDSAQWDDTVTSTAWELCCFRTIHMFIVHINHHLIHVVCVYNKRANHLQFTWCCNMLQRLPALLTQNVSECPI